MASFYELCCRECGKRFPNQPLSACDECFSSLEVAYEMAAAKQTFTREAIARVARSVRGGEGISYRTMQRIWNGRPY